MIKGDHARLDIEQVNGVAQVVEQTFGHLFPRSEQSGEYAPVILRQGVVPVHEVKFDVTMISIDDNLDGVANIVDRTARRRVGVAISNGIGILDPEKPSIMDDDIGVAVVRKEGSNFADTGLDIPIKKDPAVVAQLTGDENPVFAELQGKEQTAPQRVQGDAAFALIGGKNIFIPGGGVVKFLRAGVDDHIIFSQFAIVDRWILQIERTGRRDIAEKIAGQPFGGNLVDRADGNAVTVGILQVQVYPGLGLLGEGCSVELAGGQHYLAVFVLHGVAIDIDIVETIVRSDRLLLVKRGFQWAVVPETHIIDRARVFLQVIPGQLLPGRILPGGKAVEAVGLPGEGNIMRQVLFFEIEFAGLHGKALDSGGVSPAAQEGDSDQGQGSVKGKQGASQKKVGQAEQGDEGG